MAARGRKPKPTATLKLTGAYRKDRHSRLEPTPERGVPECPDWLDDVARAEWHRLVDPLVEAGVVTPWDRTILALYCQRYADYLAAREQLAEEGLMAITEKGNVIQHPVVGAMHKAFEHLLKTAVELGLTPSSRARVTPTAPVKQPEGAERFFAARG